MNNPIKKRANPFEGYAGVQPKAPVAEETVKEQPVQETKAEPVAPKKEPKKQVKKPSVDDKTREKYTATMLVTLRRKIKVYCATRGIMFSEFIEEACAEKLKREGE